MDRCEPIYSAPGTTWTATFINAKHDEGDSFKLITEGYRRTAGRYGQQGTNWIVSLYVYYILLTGYHVDPCTGVFNSNQNEFTELE
jgi:hypothetical protein